MTVGERRISKHMVENLQPTFAKQVPAGKLNEQMWLLMNGAKDATALGQG